MPCSLLAVSGRGYGLGFCGVCGVGKGGSLLGLTKRGRRRRLTCGGHGWKGSKRDGMRQSGGWSQRWGPRGLHHLCLIEIRLGQEWGDSGQWWGRH